MSEADRKVRVQAVARPERQQEEKTPGARDPMIPVSAEVVPAVVQTAVAQTAVVVAQRTEERRVRRVTRRIQLMK